MERTTGHHVLRSGPAGQYRAFVPAALPPEPPLAFDAALLDRIERANRALGRLDGVADLLPDLDLFLYYYVRKEAVLSSQIEGTQSSLSDLLLFELDAAPGVPLNDVREVSNHVAALEHGLERIRDGFPLSLRLLREIHGILLQGSRGAASDPGEFRRGPVWLGGTSPRNAVFVPPPHEQLMDCLDPFERFLQAGPGSLPVVIRAGLAHVQFETIHPFLDGNGRLGRVLITLLLCNAGALRQPLLYLSLHFKQYREHYYDHLQAVRDRGDWEAWLRFFLDGIIATAGQAVDNARRVRDLFEQHREIIRGLGRITGSALQVHEYLQRHPVTRVADISAATAINRTTVSTCLKRLEELALVGELTGQRRNRLFAYAPYLAMLTEDT